MAEKVEVAFNNTTGKFVVHFSGVATHEKEHELLRELIQNLRAQGFDAEVDYYHDRPKLPEVEETQGVLRIRGGEQI